MEIVDTHAHLDELDNLETALNKARESGIKAIIAVGSNMSSNQNIATICKKYPNFVYPGFGLHPWGLCDLNTSQIEETLKMIVDGIPDIIAIGEIGLDYDKRVLKKASKKLQKEVFTNLLRISVEHDKPVSIHSRYSWKDCFDAVVQAGVKKAVFHWFTGPDNILHDILDKGYFISCTPAAEYHEDHRRIIKQTPLEKLLLETDCPVVYGKENRYRSIPSDVVRSLAAVSKLKDIPPSLIGKQTTDNAKLVFGI